MTLSLVGLSHHVAPVELRERVTLDAAGAAELARSLGDVVCLSTCNRTELYLSSVDEERAVMALEDLAGEPLDGVLYRLREDEAAVHLFRVAAGLDSLVPGEGEILGQVRDAYEAVTTGPTLDRVFRQALGVGKRVRTETAIGESPASVSSAAAALAAQVFGDLQGRRVLLVGAGRIGELAASNLASRGAEIAFVANRTVETARELAHRFGGAAIGLDELAKTLGQVDVVLSSTSSPDTVVRATDVPAKRRAPLFFIDIAVPRDLDPEIASLAGCFLYDIDDLEAVVAETLNGRRAEAERAEQLVAEEAERFRAWQASLDVVPAIASLRAHAEEIRSAELAKVRVSDDERRTLESVTSQILNKLLHLPTVRMKEAAVSSDGAVYADAVKHLFGLEGVGSTEPRKSGGAGFAGTGSGDR
ncbi:MAG TPA: glutamyl-tRNA reductase [Gaiellaceae bacterium]|nr:glutamyl-tRNA reductase [Gaiellaceae bacterium]